MIASPHIAAALMRRASYASLGVALILIGVKLWAYIFTDSVAMLASLLDSLLDGAASLINVFAVRVSLTPADREHRFGHGKAEALAGLGQAFFIFASAMFVGYQAILHMLQPIPVANSTLGIAIIVFSSALTFALVLFQRYVLRRTQALAIAADSLHYKSDLLVNVGVLLALALSGIAGWHLADPLIAFLISGVIMYGAWRIIAQANAQLLDHELPEEERSRIKEIVLSHEDVRDIHELKTRISGRHRFVQLHLELDGNMPLTKAHRIADQVESAIHAEFPGTEVLIHQDPAGLREKHQPVGTI